MEWIVHINTVQSSRMCGAIMLLPPYFFMAQVGTVFTVLYLYFYLYILVLVYVQGNNNLFLQLPSYLARHVADDCLHACLPN